MAEARIVVHEGDRELSFTFADMLAYHGGRSPGGVAHAFKVLERSLPLLAPDGRAERREISIRTSFGGPGARDAFELVTRAVTAQRFTIDPSLARPELGLARERFVFQLSIHDRSVVLVLREGFVDDEFITLARREDRIPGDERRLDRLKAEMAARVMSAPASDVYDAERTTGEAIAVVR